MNEMWALRDSINVMLKWRGNQYQQIERRKFIEKMERNTPCLVRWKRLSKAFPLSLFNTIWHCDWHSSLLFSYLSFVWVFRPEKKLHITHRKINEIFSYITADSHIFSLCLRLEACVCIFKFHSPSLPWKWKRNIIFLLSCHLSGDFFLSLFIIKVIRKMKILNFRRREFVIDNLATFFLLFRWFTFYFH
jgi:hypothetical protein